MYLAETKLDSALGGRKYRKEAHFNKTVIRYESEGVKKRNKETNCILQWL